MLTSYTYASIDTKSFKFNGIFTSEEGARAAFKDAWALHVARTGVRLTWPDVSRHLKFRRIAVGIVYRDDFPLVKPLDPTPPKRLGAWSPKEDA